MSSISVADITSRIGKGALDDRLRAIEELDALVPYGRLFRMGMTANEGLIVLRAACEDWPAPQEPWLRESIPCRLLLALCSAPHPEYCELLLQNLPRFNEQETEWQALKLLSHMPQREAAEVWIEAYRRRLKAGKGVPPPFSDWDRKRLHADIILPALLEFAGNDDAWLSERLYEHVLGYVRSSDHSAATGALLIKRFAEVRPRIEAAQSPEGVGWRWRDNYLYERHVAATLLELFGYLDHEPTGDMLRATMTFYDPLLKMSAALSLLRQGKTVDRAVFADIARDPENRPQLYETLRKLKKARQFPRAFATQEAMAESDMVNWLINDISAAPDEIELMGTVDQSDRRFYVFRFRFIAPHSAAPDGWLAGVSGPWPMKGLERVPQCGGGTFSHFEPADANRLRIT